jgi:ribosomal protein S18 acetylase RimI-like enzyme
MMNDVTEGEIEIRPGRLQDLKQVSEFTRHTFTWGDYLPDRWTRWVSSNHGRLLVAASKEVVVGTARVTFLGNDEAWLEAVRVRQSHRGRGVAFRLVQAAHAIAAEKKCKVIRLETGSDNLAAQRVFRRFGYRRIVAYAGFEGAARKGELAGVRPAVTGDLNECWERWLHSWVKRSSCTIVPSAYGWRWWELTRERLRKEIRSSRVWVVTGGFMVLRDEGDAYDVTLLVGAKPATVRLLDAARELAARERKKVVYWLAPHNRIASRQAAAGDFVLDEVGLEIHACAL